MNSHLVIVKKPYLDLILRGDKTIELRLTKGKTSEIDACGWRSQKKGISGS
jgi:ASC-1-like (ASCH) protein